MSVLWRKKQGLKYSCKWIEKFGLFFSPPFNTRVKSIHLSTIHELIEMENFLTRKAPAIL